MGRLKKWVKAQRKFVTYSPGKDWMIFRMLTTPKVKNQIVTLRVTPTMTTAVVVCLN